VDVLGFGAGTFAARSAAESIGTTGFGRSEFCAAAATGIATSARISKPPQGFFKPASDFVKRMISSSIGPEAYNMDNKEVPTFLPRRKTLYPGVPVAPESKNPLL
jgi:hypothetical protein